MANSDCVLPSELIDTKWYLHNIEGSVNTVWLWDCKVENNDCFQTICSDDSMPMLVVSVVIKQNQLSLNCAVEKGA